MSETPQEIYADRGASRRAESDRWAALDARLQKVRLAVFAVGIAMLFAVFGADALAFRWLALPSVFFIALLFWHDRVLRSLAQAERATAFYERGIARLEHRFAGTGTSGSEHEPAEHAYARDLDLFGEGSVFERMCLARTRGGEEMLASWLLSPAKVETVVARQGAASELRDLLDLREDLCLVGDDVRSGLHPETLRRWGEAPPVGFHTAHRVVAVTMAVITLTVLGAWLLGSLGPAGPASFAFVGAAQLAFAWRIRSRVQATVKAVDGPTRDLDLLARLLERFEREPASSPHLMRLRRTIETEGLPPSAQIARLHRSVELLDARRNMFFAPLGGLMLWTSQLALQIESWRLACGPSLGDWIDAISELEALVSIASTAYENPSHTFPSFTENSPCFQASELGHPLIPTDVCVTNDLQLDGERQVLIVSGSNMSGKSTLLRSVGVAAVLAQAGAPVCARALKLSPLAIGASLHVIDSLQEGTSHFYAEIKRVRLVVELCEGELPLLFLLDEIFHGTNSHDRGIGAEAIVKALIERNAIGLVTTHDLALTRVAEAQGPKAANVHFEDQLEDGQIAFDYRMREGVVTKSNAIALMRSVGLPV
ncbi:MAG: DNA mismatch repair protein MutS [Deltaproteobacteria bacterium]|nr:DNA mismatch repair protein MutS [Deltaproteobacteria bacterium]MBW2394886.1 DNA mismatch repair protein MutS [Deltaproteobacteria bacterium]